MTASPRPNLGGLFNGSTPPERSSSIAGAFGPRFLTQLPVDKPAGDVPPDPAGKAGSALTEAPATHGDAPAGAGERWIATSVVDPTRIVEQYFAFLQAVLDFNRDFAVALTRTVVSLPKRGRSR